MAARLCKMPRFAQRYQHKRHKNMKKFLLLLLACFMIVSMPAMAQSDGDKIIGTYKALRNGVNSKIKVTKNSNGTYRAQVIWADNLKMPDGSIRTDVKNPDKSKRNTPADKIVLVDNVSYKNNEWSGGKIYDPTSGKSYKVTISFKDAKTLKLRGYIGIEALGETMYWTKIQ